MEMPGLEPRPHTTIRTQAGPQATLALADTATSGCVWDFLQRAVTPQRGHAHGPGR